MDRLPPLRLLIIFDAVQRLGSMQRAASELNVTRPAVSQAIRALEDYVGVQLVDRSVKPAAATEAGERLAFATRRGLEQISEAIDDIRQTIGLAERQVTVCCTLGMATYWLMPRLAGFYAAYPDIMVNVQAPPSDLPVMSAGIDVALRYSAKPWKDGATERLFSESVCPVASPKVMADLVETPDLLSRVTLNHVRVPERYGWAGWRDYLKARGLPRSQRTGQVFDNYIQAVQATLDGRGVMLGWRSITSALVDEGRLVALPGGVHDFGTAYWATCAPESEHKPAAQAFMIWVQNAALQTRDAPSAPLP
ncbi:LysR family transcriptional regulator [Roseibium sp. TrichSKD4]|uniref:LysR substrate-binding domain-containing protein n=1 Tax=Roseibium sp. TrichSKD4 TaxID=744980 RepID=UPI0001E56C3D|nr:LysR substrate-binding domain-containing protein [Roseibium sp. TrichSKD4]EFO32690.1 LysR family transcriptional regulator [Roseibium sp. TrichSKD4]